jgi:aspartyl-tRNA(Asn)/glutamyl-tRNA(Gln) amidotransferase subunit B
VTVLQRLKEVEQEYRYFPEPDLIPLTFDRTTSSGCAAPCPNCRWARKHRLIERYGLPAWDAAQIVNDRALADYYEAAAKDARDPKTVANWLLGDLTRLANAAGVPVYASPVPPQNLAELVALIDGGAITGKIAKTVIEAMFAGGKTAAEVIKEQGLTVQGRGRGGRHRGKNRRCEPRRGRQDQGRADKSIGFLVGQVMKEAKGRAKPDDVNRLLKDALDRVP